MFAVIRRMDSLRNTACYNFVANVASIPKSYEHLMALIQNFACVHSGCVGAVVLIFAWCVHLCFLHLGFKSQIAKLHAVPHAQYFGARAPKLYLPSPEPFKTGGAHV